MGLLGQLADLRRDLRLVILGVMIPTRAARRSVHADQSTPIITFDALMTA
jgi:hypothetical protein